MGIAQKGSGSVVIGVQESYSVSGGPQWRQSVSLTEGLLLQDKKHGIDQLNVLGNIIKLGFVSLRALHPSAFQPT